MKKYTLIVVHAHPDDEASTTGGLLRLAADNGHTTILVTCTNGEQGEVKDQSLRLNPRENPADRRRLAAVRRDELAKAAAILRITHNYMLAYPDSGMQGSNTNAEPLAFVNANPEEVTGRLVNIIRQHHPDVMVTYDEKGGYGHPDHIMTHRMTISALEAAADPQRFPGAGQPWQVRKVYYTAWAHSQLLRVFKVMHVLGRKTPLRDPNFDPSTLGCPDELITTRIDVRPVMRSKWRALFAHRSQIGRGNFFWWFLRLTGRWLYPYESFRCIYSAQPLPRPEVNIFTGL